jgi:deazaflavin-dependent oxidoreductase (nitroreductase family)
MTETFLYLTTTGRKSGQPHRIEIWYVAYDGRYYMVSEHYDASHWVKNILENPRVQFSVGTRENAGSVVKLTDGFGVLIDRGAEPELAARVSAAMDAKYAWSDGLIVQLTPAQSG